MTDGKQKVGAIVGAWWWAARKAVAIFPPTDICVVIMLALCLASPAAAGPRAWTQIDNTAPDDTAPDNTAPDDTAPDNTAPDNTAPDDTAPDDTATNPATNPASAELWIALAGDRAPGSAFIFTSPMGVSLLFDPWFGPASGSWGLWFSDDGSGFDIAGAEVDGVLASHPDRDRDGGTMPDGTPLLDRLDGSWDLADVRVIGFADNNITKVIMGGVHILIWGEGLPGVDAGLWADIGAVDVLMLPIENTQTSLSYTAAAIIIDRLAPDIIIPGLYLAAGIDAARDQLGAAEDWTRQQYYHTILREPHLSLTDEWVHSHDRHVQYFGNHHLLD